ncbi:MarR family winged helix-turn-helix transcriptional regulator [Bosea minatitlanensis]|uniref:MarR family winged helix-turn-helix transcriptional regulator n=1 Tax=Bosea minatitlanensis TaxID=128782 RepID=A0ABW0F0G1_9HYPH|nr:helix-turn-helix domain-containing protein [Bosea minatitlanensis]MCT4492403.1 MarR family transcriptional regulator [Bosea minatitlanensis]
MSLTALTKGLLLVKEFRNLNAEMPAQQIALFLLIARQPRATLADLNKQLGQGKSSINRNVAALAEKYGLVEYGRDPADARNNIAWLTPKGQNLVNTLETILG